MALPSIIRDSKNIDAEGFLKVVESTINVIRYQKNSSYLTILGGLIKLKPIGQVMVIGDLHGDLASLTTIIKKSNYLEKMKQNKSAALVFLGDYGDRGPNSPELYYVVLTLKLAFPSQVILLRGNHEAPSDLIGSPHDLPIQLEHKFHKEWVLVYLQLKELFSYLYTAVYVEGRYLMVHGGLPARLRSLHEIADAYKLHPVKPFLEELLWNDPDEEVRGVFPSPRGAGELFGKDVTQNVLQKLNAKILIRGHESANDGFKINHGGKILTLFSSKGIPYFNKNGAYLELSLATKFENANQLLPYIHKF